LKLGIQAYPYRTGLGYQALGLHKHLHPAKTMVIDQSEIKGITSLPDWYPPGPDVTHIVEAPTDQHVEEWLDGLDVVLVCETPHNYRLFSAAADRRIATVLQFNFEFLDHLVDPHLPWPTVLADPAGWNTTRVTSGRVPIWPLPVPVDGDDIPWQARTEVHTVGHVAGIPAAWDRAGTLDFIQAAKDCADLPVEWVLHCQAPNQEITKALSGSSVHLVGEVPDRAAMYAGIDLLVYPRRWGGLCLPAQEAVASGIPVIMPDLSPNNSWLPQEWLVPASWMARFPARAPIDVHQVDPVALAVKVRDVVAAPSPHFDTASSMRAAMTWDTLLPVYEDFLARAVEAAQ
jgi:hypothetical protein